MTTLAKIKELLLEDLRTLDPNRSVDWALVVELAKLRGVEVTRQWLSRDGDIQKSFQEALRRHRRERKPSATRSTKPKDLLAALEQLKILKSEVARRDETIALYDRRFIRYLNNARKRDISIAELEAE